MKKLLVLITTMLMLSISALAMAAEKGAQIPVSQKINDAYAAIWHGAQGTHTKVGIVYKNNAKTTYDDEIDVKLLEAIVAAIKPQDHVLVDATASLEELQNIGVNDLAMAERADLIDVLGKKDLDYAVIVQVDPFVRKERVAMFRYTLEMTSNIPFKIIDVKSNRYIFNGKLVEFAKHGSAVGGVSNKATVMKVLEAVCPQIQQNIAKIPKG